MGFRVSTIGHMDVTPPLNDAEFGYLTAFAESRRWSRAQGEFWIPMGPFGLDEEHDGVPSDDYNEPPGGQPGLWCPWVPSCSGACLLIRDEGNDGKNYGIAPWLEYLIGTFLGTNGRARREAGFEAFTFDHEVSGVIATHRSDDGAFALVRAAAGRVWSEQVRRGDPL